VPEGSAWSRLQLRFQMLLAVSHPCPTAASTATFGWEQMLSGISGLGYTDVGILAVSHALTMRDS
jgi:hypothetical protein